MAAQQTQYCLQFYVPKKNTAEVIAAVHETGAGSYPSTYPGGPSLYHECAFITTGTGRFKPSKDAMPHIGKAGEVEDVPEDKVEIMCFGKDIAEAAVKALLASHPYEQVPYFLIKGEDW